MPDARYLIVDVFTGTPFTGNPLAVFLDGAGFTGDQMQAITRELNLSETTFVTPGSAPGHFAVRIFTPATELPFAGHPTIGTAVALAERGFAKGRPEIVLEEGVGPVRVTLGEGHAVLHRDGAPELLPVQAAAGDVAAALGVAAADLAGPAWQASYGNHNLFVPLANRDAVAHCAVRSDRFQALGLAAHGIYAFAVLERGPHSASLHARFFAPGLGVGEDPATGSAAAALAGSIPGFDPAGELHLAIAQGVEMGRRSLLKTVTRFEAGRVAGISVGGSAVIVGEGRFTRLP